MHSQEQPSDVYMYVLYMYTMLRLDEITQMTIVRTCTCIIHHTSTVHVKLLFSLLAYVIINPVVVLNPISLQATWAS